MNAEQLFWMVNEFIKDTLTECSETDLIHIESTLPEEGVLSFDINKLLENV